MICRACSSSSLPKTWAMPFSVAMALIWCEVIGEAIFGTTVETPAFGCRLRRAMIASPPGECRAPTRKSVEPPVPE